jgi:hypothetical protein
MPLEKNSLQAAIKAAFQKAKETPPPDDPSQSDQVQEEILDTLSQDLADAIEAYVHGGDVGGVTVTVRDIANVNVIGTGTQAGTVKIQ